MKFQFGIEHEVAFLRSNGDFADFLNTTYEEFAAIVDRLPEYEADQACLRMGDLGIRRKRWYIEGIERFDVTGKMVKCIPKGIEIRTTIHSSVQGAVMELRSSFEQLVEVAGQFGFTPIDTSFNPKQTAFTPDPPLNAYEIQRMAQSPEDRTEHLPLLTYGPDLNLSVVGATVAQTIDWAKKLTYYSPYLTPFSYSPCQYESRPWPGKSVRTFYRTGLRPAVLAFVKEAQDVINCDPSLIKLTSKASEWGRIEFKAFDSCGDFDRYAALFVLLKGLLLDQTLTGRAVVPDRALHQHSARQGWDSEQIYDGSVQVLNAAMRAIVNSSATVLEGLNDRTHLQRLAEMLQPQIAQGFYLTI
jgi:hypothetical protein